MHQERLTGWDTELQEHWPPPRPQPEEGDLADGKDTHAPAGLGASLPSSGEERNERESSEEKNRAHFQKRKKCANAWVCNSTGLSGKGNWVKAEGWLSRHLTAGADSIAVVSVRSSILGKEAS